MKHAAAAGLPARQGELVRSGKPTGCVRLGVGEAERRGIYSACVIVVAAMIALVARVIMQPPLRLWGQP